MALPLIPIVIGSIIRMAAPKVAKMLIKRGIGKKASQAAVNKLRSPAKKISAKDANKLATTQKNVPKGPGSRPVPVNKAYQTTKSGRVKLSSSGKPMLKKTKPPKKNVESAKDQAKGLLKAGTVLGTAAAVGSALKKEPPKASGPNIPTPKRKPKPPKRATESIPAGGFDAGAMKPKAKAKPKAKPKDEAMSMGEYLEGAVGMRGAKGLEGAKRKVKTPLGTLTFDTSDDAFEPDVENKAGGRIKRQAGGKVRGVGQAMKGFGKATYSDKMF